MKTIESQAFAGCSNLLEIELPDGTKEIGYGAFSNCDNLAVLSIPDEVLDIKLEQLKEDLAHINNLKTGVIPPQRCEHCDYCRWTKKLSEIIDYRDL